MSYSVFVLSFSLFLFLLQCSLDILMLVFVATVSTHCINYGLLVHDCRVVARVSLCLVQSNRASICLFVCLSVWLCFFACSTRALVKQTETVLLMLHFVTFWYDHLCMYMHVCMYAPLIGQNAITWHLLVNVQPDSLGIEIQLAGKFKNKRAKIALRVILWFWLDLGRPLAPLPARPSTQPCLYPRARYLAPVRPSS